MKLDGWNHIPEGYGLTWDLSGAPLWLRFWFHVPLVDRFSYPVIIQRGYAWLSPHPDWPETERDEVPPGWRVGPRTPTAAPPRWKNHS